MVNPCVAGELVYTKRLGERQSADSDRLIRMSVGIEATDELIADLAQVLES